MISEVIKKSIQNALRPLGIEVFAAHAGEEHDLVVEKMLEKGYEIMITQVASDGLMRWLGKTITKTNWQELKEDSVRFPPVHIVPSPEEDIVGSATTMTVCTPEVAVPHPDPLHIL